MPAPIVVEVYAPQPQPQELAALIAACTRAAAPNECITSEARPPDSPLGVAIVRRDGDRARIELGLRGLVRAEWSTRELAFQPGDDELERYRAIGFAIGTLVTRQVAPPEPPTLAPAPPEQPPEPARSPPAPPAPPPRSVPVVGAPRTRATWLDVSGGLGLGLIPGAPRMGGTLRAATELLPGGTFGTAETGYAERAGDDSLRVRWLTLALGIGHPLLPHGGPLGVSARLALVIQRLSATAVSGSKSQADWSWKPGASASVDACWEAAPPLGVLLGAAAHVDPKRTVIKTQSAQVAETPALGFEGFVGLRIKLR